MLPQEIIDAYNKIKPQIQQRLEDFSRIEEKDYFYEMCFCILTPQSMAKHAIEVVEKLKKRNFFERPFDSSDILGDKRHYIRFHRTKANKLVQAVESYPKVLSILKSDKSDKEKRMEIMRAVNGFGMKEASHFLRNIGFRGLTILDRHILKLLVVCCVYTKAPEVNTVAKYLKVENEFLNFAQKEGYNVDELDLLFWSMKTGEILK